MVTLPNFNTATFAPGDPIDNQYFPLKPGTIYVYKGSKQDDETGKVERESDRYAVTFQTKTITGVAATVVRDTEWTNGILQEDTDDWYAQDTDGNVWYLGEATTAFEYDDEGNFIGTNNKGGWQAGVNGALPGHIMKGNPQVNDNYYQEFAPNDAAVDQAIVVSRGKTISTGLGTFNNVLQTLDFTDLEPGALEYKYYAPGIGLVFDEEGLDANLQPDFSFELASIKTVTSDAFSIPTDGDDAINGDDLNNTLRGLRGSDLLQGLGGADGLTGQDGSDFLVGGDGLDRLKGGNGRDILVGGGGSDLLVGGKHRDQFVFRTLEDRGDRIQDFSRQDVIVLAEIFESGNYGSTNPIDDYLEVRQLGSRTVIRIDPDGDAGSNPFQVLATLKNTNASLLTDDNFVV